MLVVSRLTGSAISVTANQQFRVVVLSILGNSLYVYEILLRGDVGPVDVEEYRYRSCNKLLSCGSLLLSKQFLQTGILGISIVELSVEGVNLRLRESLDSVNIGSLVPRSLTKVEGQTYLSVEVVVVRIPATVASCVIEAINIVLQTVPTKFEVDSHFTAYIELVQDTSAKTHAVSVVAHRARNTGTEEWNKVPNTIRIVTIKHVAQVEQNLLVKSPVLVAYISAQGAWINLLAPDALKFGTETESRSEPLTNGKGNTGIRAETLDGAVREV